MLTILSPAKTLDFENARIVEQESFPEFSNKADELVKILKKYTVPELMDLMSISVKLALQTEKRFKIWQNNPPEEFARQAICAFSGEVYTCLNVSDWDNSDFSFAQKHIRILSGLYGVLRPLDYIRPYRLEMGSKLQTHESDNLYKYWGNLITDSLLRQLKDQDGNVLINLASNEYFKSINQKKIKAEIITPVFKDFKDGKYRIIVFYTKQARGLMSRFVVKNQLNEPEQLKEFTDGGYYYNDRLSKGNEWVFTRD